jgi:hypothetical protein
MKKHLLTFCCAIVSILSQAQERFSISLGTGLGIYKMDDLKRFEKISSSLNMETINNYPPYLFWTGEASMKIAKEFRIGLVYELNSTGYKSAYSDYSGVIKSENIIKSDNAGIVIGGQFWQQNKFSLSTQLRIYHTWSELKRQYSTTFYTPLESQKSTFKYFSQTFSLTPDVRLAYRVWERLSLNLSLGYCYDFRGDLKQNSSNGNPYLPKPPNFTKPSQSDWSGLRLGLSTSFHF